METYTQAVQKVADLEKTGDHDGAIEVLKEVLKSGISDLDKSLMCYNMAVIFENKKDFSEAERWYNRGIDYERPHYRFWVLEHKAAYFSRQQRNSDALRIYRDLIGRPYLMEADKDRVNHNIRQLGG